MSPHPKFDRATSTCLNCLAFCGEEVDGTPYGQCRRFAPKASSALVHYDAEAESTGSTDPNGVSWPFIDSEFEAGWCLDWLPAASPMADDPRWRDFFECLSVRAKNALHRAGIRSFAQLDGLADRDLRLLPNVGSVTVREIRDNRQAVPGGRTA